MTDDKTTAEMLTLIIKSLRARKDKSRVNGTLMDIEHQAKKISDPALREQVMSQCRDLLDSLRAAEG